MRCGPPDPPTRIPGQSLGFDVHFLPTLMSSLLAADGGFLF